MSNRSLVLLTILTLALGLGGWWMHFKDRKQPYNRLPGVYECEGFGVPDGTYPRLRVEQDFKLFGVSKKGDFLIGQLSPKNFSAANLELTMAVIHSPGFELDPFTPIVIEGVGNRITVSGKGQKGYFTKYCPRVY